MFGLCGLGNGTVSTLYSLVALEAAGLNMQLPVLSLAGLVTGFWFLLVDPLTGLVRDSSGSYSVCLGVLGCFLLASVALWFFLPTPSSASRLHSQLDIEGHPLVPSSKNRPSR
ncbi:hypothetical protein O3P69_009622 [Scylla paramamosain]|uniref:Uncharacterized protein n=1 Tax=Scylla paramamosain TaxID=85552 RepID=A0AAW0SW78_SCYPA